MSSTAYSTCLDADPGLRRLTLVLALAFAGVGLLLIAMMPAGAFVRGAAAAAWLLVCVRDITGFRRGYGRYRRLSIDQDRQLRLLDVGGNWRPARVLPGSIVLRRYAWLRICDDEGLVFAEPVRGRCRANPEWRRLQVLWRHVGAASRSC